MIATSPRPLRVSTRSTRRSGGCSRWRTRCRARSRSTCTGGSRAGRTAPCSMRVEDTLTLGAFQCFEFQGLEDYPLMLEPLLFYVLHRANAAIRDQDARSRLKLFLLDEAWRFAKDPTVKAYMVEALKTWRKHNAAMLLATQSDQDFVDTDLLRAVIENCPTKFFLANPGIDIAHACERFHLTDARGASHRRPPAARAAAAQAAGPLDGPVAARRSEASYADLHQPAACTTPADEGERPMRDACATSWRPSSPSCSASSAARPGHPRCELHRPRHRAGAGEAALHHADHPAGGRAHPRLRLRRQGLLDRLGRRQSGVRQAGEGGRLTNLNLVTAAAASTRSC